MTTSWSQTPGGTLFITLRPGIVVRLIGFAFLGVALYVFVWPLLVWIVSVFRSGGSGVGLGDVAGTLLVLVMAAAFGVPGAMLAFFGQTARVEPVPRRVFTRHGFMGFGGERATEIGEGARVAVKHQVDVGTRSSTSTFKNDYQVITYKVFVEHPGAEPAEIGQFSGLQGDRARELAAAAAKTLALTVSDRTKAADEAAPKSDRMTSEFLQKHGVEAPPKGFLVRAIGVVRSVVEALISS
jgi:hypothetical protein